MFKNGNDSDGDARGLVRLIRRYRLPARVNPIPFNPWPGVPDRIESGKPPRLILGNLPGPNSYIRSPALLRPSRKRRADPTANRMALA